VLGDSISLSSGIGPVLGRYGYPVVGLVGQSVSDGYLTAHLTSQTAQDAPVWVIELGTNNSGAPGDVGRLAGWIDLIDSLRTPGDKQRVLWVTPYRPVSSDARSQSALDDFNGELARLAAQHAWLRLIDFATVAKAHTEWFDQDSALHVHPDANGQGALVAMIAGPDAVPAATSMPVIDATPTLAPDPSPEDSVAPEDQVFDNSTS
jgi:lysophospholipase L1-like esterase